MNSCIKLFSGSAHPALAEQVGQQLGIELGKVTIGHFPNGETTVQFHEKLQGTDVFILQSMCEPVNHHWMEFFMMMDAARRGA